MGLVAAPCHLMRARPGMLSTACPFVHQLMLGVAGVDSNQSPRVHQPLGHAAAPLAGPLLMTCCYTPPFLASSYSGSEIVISGAGALPMPHASSPYPQGKTAGFPDNFPNCLQVPTCHAQDHIQPTALKTGEHGKFHCHHAF